MTQNNGLDPHVHFNLGTDRLATTDEITEMHDPWLTTAAAPEVEHVEAGVHMPEGDFSEIKPRQLPGV